MQSNIQRFVLSHRYVLSAIFSAGFSMGCVVDADDGGDDNDGSTDIEIAAGCQSYCDKARECDDEVSIDECVNDCKSRVGDCMADEQDETVSDLNSCASDACDDFNACTIGAGLQCTFGL